MSKYQSSDAILLRAVGYGEGNRIFTCFGRENGKFSAVARGVLKPKSKLKGHLQLGNRCDLQLVNGRGLKTIASAVAKETYAANREKAECYFYMSYFLELFNDFLPEDAPDENLFFLLDAVLKSLGDTDPPLLARFFELKLLAAAGYAVDTEHCAVCAKKLNGGFYDTRRSVLTCENCGSGMVISPKAHFALRYLEQTDPNLVSRLKVDDETKSVLFTLNKNRIEHSLEKKVRSLEILRKAELD